MLYNLFRFLFSGRGGGVNPSGRYFITSRQESQERIRRLGLDKGSEDASAILDGSTLVWVEEAGSKGFGPDPDREWIIELTLAQGGVIKIWEIKQLFDKAWRQQFKAAVVYGHSWVEDRWFEVFASGVPEGYDKICVGVRLMEAEVLEENERSIKKRCGGHPGIIVTIGEAVGAVIERASRLKTWKSGFGAFSSG